jgi:hypothetical protein
VPKPIIPDQGIDDLVDGTTSARCVAEWLRSFRKLLFHIESRETMFIPEAAREHLRRARRELNAAEQLIIPERPRRAR